MDRVESLPFYDEDNILDTYGGSLDALTGMCHRDCHYHTVPKPPHILALESVAESIASTLAPLPPHHQLLVLNRAKDLVASQIKIPA